MIKKKIEIPIYLGYLVIIVTDDFKKIIKKYNIASSSDPNDHDYSAITFRLYKKRISNYYCVLRKKASPGAIAHEAKHIVNKIFQDRGINLDIVNDENETYLLGWIVNQIYKILKK